MNMNKEAYKRKCEPTLVFIQMVGLRLPRTIDKEKTAHTFGYICWNTYNTPKEERPLLIPIVL